MSIPTFIDVEVTDQTNELRSYLKELGGNIPESSGEDNVKDLLNCIEASDVCWKEINSETDLEMVFNGIISMMLLIPAELNEEPVHLFCKKLADCPKGDKKGSIRLRILSNLFHGLEDKSHLKADVYLSLLRLSRDADLASMVITDLDQVKKWISEWDIGTKKVQNMYRALHETLIAARNSEHATKVMIELLGTYTEDNASQARDDAQRCIVTCLEDPNTFLFDHLLTLKPVKFLEGAPIHDLLTIFVSGKLSDYQQFYKNNKPFINSLGLSHDENLRKMRLLTFMHMAETKKDIEYESIQKEMDMPESEVENFIIDVVKTRAVQVKIDQLQKKVVITSTTHRTFGRQHWQLLHQKLIKWQTNLSNVQTSLRALEIMQAQQAQSAQ
ncbi:eukaryotic translation initiation factor 3 subunit M-like [Ruditapes philippinarum]|uniref:eukaryotic translation initiation factor 3 subunit M-like n=1 Tax=Ruditapes philippinarum TaxID=129788 RepID=UPI00295B2D2F|nr:eukaryotic translation initiation factor 3 subunit M-like [Ruditapes philippinarum]